jgi:Glycosyl transferase family 2
MGPEQSGSRKVVTVVIVVSGRCGDTATIYRSYRDGLALRDGEYEFIYVMDGSNPTVLAALNALQSRGEPVTIVPLPRQFGEMACLREGVKHAQAERILVLPAYLQVTPESMSRLIEALDTADFVAAKRDRRADNVINRLRGRGFQRMARIAGSSFEDLGCIARAFRREVVADFLAQDIPYAFLPLFVERAGFVVAEVLLPQAASDTTIRAHHPIAYLESVLDIVTTAFLLKFTNKPFRFFGSIGFFSAVAGVLLCVEMVIERFLWNTPMNERPLLILAVLLIVLGIQIATVGLIAEIIIFTRTKVKSTYRIRQVVEHASDESEKRPAGEQQPTLLRTAGEIL